MLCFCSCSARTFYFENQIPEVGKQSKASLSFIRKLGIGLVDSVAGVAVNSCLLDS